MKLSAKVASVLSFAHLAGLGRSKAAKAEDDDKKDRDHEDVDAKKATKAEDDKPDEDDKDKKDGPDASAEDDDPDAEGDDPEKKDEDDKKDAKAKADDGDDKDDDKMKAGAKAERARCAAIFASPAAAKNVALAAELAFATDLSAAQAIGILGKAPAASVGHPNRAAANPRVGAGSAPEVTGKQAVDSSWDRAFARVNPQKRK